MSNSTGQVRTLELFQHPPRRRFFCHLCKQEVSICLLCDHGQMYCKTCKKNSKLKSNKEANKRYRDTLKGKKTRAACENRRRKILRKKSNNSEICKIMGETSTKITKVLPDIKIGAEVVPKETKIDLEKGENDVPVSETQVDRDDPLGFSSKRGNNKTILCAYCSKECSALTYNNLLSKKVYKKRYWKIRNAYNS